MARLVPIIVRLDGSQAKAEAREIESIWDRINAKSAQKISQNFNRTDIRQTQKLANNSAELSQAAETTRRLNTLKLNETRTFTEAEKQKVQAIINSSNQQKRQAEQAANAANAAKNREAAQFAQSEQRKTAVAISESKRRESASRIGGTGQQIGGQIAAFGVGLTASITAPTVALATLGVQFNAMKETALTSFGVLLKSGEKAQTLFNDLQQFAAATPFELPELLGATRSLLAFGVANEEVVETLKRIGDISSGIGAGANVGEIAQIYGKARVQGRLFAEDINQLTGRGIPIIQELAKQFGVADSEVKKLVEDGKVGFPQIEKAFKDLTSASGIFAGQTESLSKTFSGQMSTLKDVINQSLGDVTAPLFEGLKVVLPVIIDLIGRAAKAFGELSPNVKLLITAFVGIAAAIGPVVVIIGGLVVAVASVVSAFATLAAAGITFSVLGTAIAGIGVIIAGLVAGVGLAVGVIYQLTDAWANGWGEIASLVAIAGAGIISAISPILGLPVLIGATLYSLYQLWQTNFGGIRAFVTEVFDKILVVIKTVMTAIYGVVQSVGGQIVSWWTANYPLIRQLVVNVSEGIKSVINVFMNVVRGFWQSHGETIIKIVTTLWNAVKYVISGVVSVIGGIIRIGLQLINKDWSGAWKTFLDIVTNSSASISFAARKIVEVVDSALSALIPVLIEYGKQFLAILPYWIGLAVLGMINIMLTLPARIAVVLIQVIDEVINFIPKFFAAAFKAGNELWNGIVSGYNQAKNSNPLVAGISLGGVGAGATAEGAKAGGGYDSTIQKAISTSGGGSSRGGGGGKTATKAKLTELQELQKAAVDATAALNFLYSNPEVQRLQVQIDETNELKSALDEIIKVRSQLKVNEFAVLPRGAENIKAELEQLNRIKSIRENILSIQKESVEMEDKILTARLTANAEIISAQSRSDLAYFEGIRERRNAEAQLTTDLASEFRRRADFGKNYQSEVLRSQTEAYRDFIAEQNDRDNERLKTIARIQILSGADFGANAQIEASRQLSQKQQTFSPVVNEIKSSNKILDAILKAVSAGKGTDGANAEQFRGNIQTSATRTNFSGAPTKRAAEVLRSVLKPSAADATFQKAALTVSKETGVAAQDIFTLLKATYFRESGGGKANSNASSGASGPLQQLPDTARRLGVKDPYKLEDASLGAARYLVRGFSDKDKGGGLLGGGVKEAFATYFAGEGGGNRGEKTRDYVKAQTYVFEQATKAFSKLNSNLEQLPDSLPSGPPVLPSYAPIFGQAETNQVNVTASRPRINEDANLVSSLFGVPDISTESLQKLGGDANKSIADYQENRRQFNENTKEQVIAADKLNQLGNVKFTQTRNLEILEARLLSLRESEVARTEVLQNAEIARKQNLIGLESENIVLTERLRNGGRDAEVEAAQLANARLNILAQVGIAEAALAESRALNANAEVQRARQLASVTNERTELENRLAAIENQRATSGVNQALRERVAIEEELLRIHNADFEAQEQIARLSVQLGNKEIFSQVQSDAKVLEYLNQNIKSVTESVTDFRIGLAEGYLDAISAPFDALSKKLENMNPIIRGLAQTFINLARDIVKAFSQKLILRLLGLDNPVANQAGGSRGGGGGGIFDFIRGIFGGGASGGGGIGGTPNFNPGNLASSGGGGGGGFNIGSLFGGSNRQSNLPGIFGGGGNNPFQILGGTPSFNPGGNGAPTIGGGSGARSSGIINMLIGLFGGNTSRVAGGGVGGGGGALSSLFSSGGISSALASGGITALIALAQYALTAPTPLKGLATGGLIGLAIGFINQSKLRRKEEVLRTTYLREAIAGLADFDKLILDLKNLRIEPDTAIQQGKELSDALRANYLQNAKSLTDKKTRNIALKSVSELDYHIGVKTSELVAAAGRARTAGEVDKLLVPEFAGGVFMDEAFIKQYGEYKYRNGLQAGTYTGIDTLPSIIGKGEMVLNPRQIEAVKKASGFDPFGYADIPNYTPREKPIRAAEGFYNSNNASVFGSQNNSTSTTKQPINVTVVINSSGLVQSDITDVLIDGISNDFEVKAALDKQTAKATLLRER